MLCHLPRVFALQCLGLVLAAGLLYQQPILLEGTVDTSSSSVHGTKIISFGLLKEVLLEPWVNQQQVFTLGCAGNEPLRSAAPAQQLLLEMQTNDMG